VAISPPSGEPFNVGQMYALFAQAIRGGDSRQLTFETAVNLHRLVDAIKQASDNGSRGDVRMAAAKRLALKGRSTTRDNRCR
jgi:predicted dehydrogenase